MITGYVIGLACANAYYGDACRKAAEAFAKQTQIEQSTITLEQRGEGTAKVIAKEYVGSDTVRAAAYIYGGYKVYNAKSVHFDIPNYGLADHIDTQLNMNYGQLNFRWHF